MISTHNQLSSLAVLLAAITFATVLPTAVSAESVLRAESVKVSGSLRTFYFNRDFKDGNTDRVSLTQALNLNTSGEANESIRWSSTLTANLKLDGHGNDQFIGSLDEKSNGYIKLSELYGDFAITDATTVRAGRWITSYALFNDQDNRATRASTQAIQLEHKFTRSTLYALYSDRASAKTQAEFEPYVDAQGNRYGVSFFGVSGTFGNWGYTGEYGTAGNFASQAYLNVSYLFAHGTKVDFYQYRADYGDGHTRSPGKNSRLTNIALRLPLTDTLKLTLSYQGIGGNSAYRASWGGQDDPGFITWGASQYSNFNRKSEDSYLIRFDYQTPIHGLKAMIRYADAQFEQAGEQFDHQEMNIRLRYEVAQVSGLTLRAMLARARIETGGEDINEIRLFADYRF